jgi:hypothetical protein
MTHFAPESLTFPTPPLALQPGYRYFRRNSIPGMRIRHHGSNFILEPFYKAPPFNPLTPPKTNIRNLTRGLAYSWLHSGLIDVASFNSAAPNQPYINKEGQLYTGNGFELFMHENLALAFYDFPFLIARPNLWNTPAVYPEWHFAGDFSDTPTAPIMSNATMSGDGVGSYDLDFSAVVGRAQPFWTPQVDDYQGTITCLVKKTKLATDPPHARQIAYTRFANTLPTPPKITVSFDASAFLHHIRSCHPITLYARPIWFNGYVGDMALQAIQTT